MKSKKSKFTIVIRADSSKKIGTGHIARDLELAKSLKSHANIIFLTKDNPSSIKKIKQDGFKTILIPEKTTLSRELKITKKILEKINPDIIILDIWEKYKDPKFVSVFKERCRKLVCFFDEPVKRVIDADIVINGHPRQNPDWYKKSSAKYLVSPRYFVMNPRFADFNKKKKKILKRIKQIFITFGGSDHNNLIFKFLKTIDEIPTKFKIVIAIGLAFGEEEKLNQLIKTMGHKVKVKKNIPNLIDILYKSDIAITSAGNTIFERLAIGTPGITINQLDNQNTIASAFAKKKSNINLGMHQKVDNKKFSKKLSNLIEDAHLRKFISISGKKQVDGLGLRRVTNHIIKLLY